MKFHALKFQTCSNHTVDGYNTSQSVMYNSGQKSPLTWNQLTHSKIIPNYSLSSSLNALTTGN